MKKNLLSILILALLVVNIVLSVLVLVSVSGTNKKTADMVTKIAAAMDMELSEGFDSQNKQVAIGDIVTHDVPGDGESLTIPLKRGADGKDHYYVVAVTFSMDSTHKDYKTYGESIGDRDSILKGEIIEVISGYTLEELQVDPDAAKEKILERVQTLFGSDFIFKVNFSDVKYS